MTIAFEMSPEYDLYSSHHAAPIIENYATERQITQTELSAIYIMRHRDSGEKFTLKAIKKMEGIQFDFEKLIQIKHENIVELTSHYETERFHYVIKPYVEGVDLHKYIDANGTLDAPQLNLLIKQLLSAIRYLHDRKDPLIFRDLKPSNIIVENPDEGFRIKLIDIETMRQKDVSKRADTYYVMSHGYAPPEQYGYRQSDVRSDVYSLGATLYFAITGEPPKASENIQSFMGQNSDQIDAKLLKAIEKCLRFDPINRYQNIFELEMAIYGQHKLMSRKNLVVAAAVLILSIGISYAFRLDFSPEDEAHAMLVDEVIPLSASEIRKSDFMTLPLNLNAGFAGRDLYENMDLINLSDDAIVPDETDALSEDGVEVATENILETTSIIESIESTIEQSVEATTERAVEPTTERITQPTTEESTTVSASESSGETVVLNNISISPSAPVSTSNRPLFSSLSDAVISSYGKPSVQIASRPSEYTTLSGYDVIGERSGIYVLKQKDQDYVIAFDRDLLPVGQRQFRYMSVFSYGDDYAQDQYALWARSAVEKGYGLNDMYTGTGFYSRNSLTHYVIFLFNEDFSHVGTVEMRDVR